jgi:prepilin peptidase CpaA
MNSSLLIGVIVLVVTAAAIDVRTRKIPNWLTLPACLVGIGLNFFHLGTTGLLSGLLGIVTGFSLLALVYLLGGMGAGDVKLLSAVGAFVGPCLVFYAFIWMALSGGVMAVALILAKKAVVKTGQNLKLLVTGWMLGSSGRHSNLTIQNQSLHKLTYGVAIATGTILAVLLQRLPSFQFQDGWIRFSWFGG